MNNHAAEWAHLTDNQYCTLEADGVLLWRNPEGQLHRVNEKGVQDGPAAVYPDGTQYWAVNDRWHRVSGPACIYPDGRQVWYLNGHKRTQEEWSKDHRVVAYRQQTQG